MRTIKKSLFPIIALCVLAVLLVTACKDEDDPAPPASTTFTVTFDKNEGTTDADPTTKTVTAPATTVDALPTPPARTDYLFDGWNTQANGEGEAFTADNVVTASITVYAQWTADERIALTVETENEAVDAAKADTTADVEFTFTGTAPTGLTKDDFVVTSSVEGITATIANDEAVVVGENKVTVTISFAANPSEQVLYTVAINPASTLIKGDAEVVVTHNNT
ncbi:MAG: InlB B-repeat-containing protein [Treponema sp.]|jgi:uncharacterized repeat protein (TIGR02543 family)|nr:InlB B-repeat-containing protein [Treponema sp.]